LNVTSVAAPASTFAAPSQKLSMDLRAFAAREEVLLDLLAPSH